MVRCRKCKKGIPEGSAFCCWCGAQQAPARDGEIKVPEPRRLSSGKWFIQLRLGGKSIPVTEDTRAKCLAKARAIKSGILEAKTPEKAASRTLGSILDAYINSHRGVVSPSTIRGYITIRNNFMQPEMEQRYNQINWQHAVQREAKERATKTMRNCWALVASAVSYAKLPVPEVDLPSVQSQRGAYLTARQILTFLEAVKGEEVELAALLALHSLRRSELAAATWEDLDVAAETITVSGAVVIGDTGKTRKSTNKNASSRRVIPFLIPRLKELLLELPTPVDPTQLVLSHYLDWVRNAVNRVCASAGLPPVGCHGLRRSFASLGYYLGLDERTIMHLGGWSDLATMHKAYIRLAEDADQTAKTAFTAFFRPPAPEASNTENQPPRGVVISESLQDAV